MTNKAFSERIKNIRLDNNMTMDEFAKLLNVSKSRINMWENNGSVPRIDILIKISKHFKKSIDYLLGNENILKVRNPLQVYSETTGQHFANEINKIINHDLLTNREKGQRVYEFYCEMHGRWLNYYLM